MLVQVDALAETWIWNAVAYAASQVSATWQIELVAPRSTCSHCGSLNWLDHRVPELRSTAAEAGVPAFSTEAAVAGRPWAALAVPQLAATVPYTWNSHREYPYGVARVMPYTRTYRPVPPTVRVCVPPVPVVVE